MLKSVLILHYQVQKFQIGLCVFWHKVKWTTWLEVTEIFLTIQVFKLLWGTLNLCWMHFPLWTKRCGLAFCWYCPVHNIHDEKCVSKLTCPEVLYVWDSMKLQEMIIIMMIKKNNKNINDKLLKEKSRSRQYSKSL